MWERCLCKRDGAVENLFLCGGWSCLFSTGGSSVCFVLERVQCVGVEYISVSSNSCDVAVIIIIFK